MDENTVVWRRVDDTFLLPFSTVLAAQLGFVDGKCKHVPVPNYISQTSLFDFQGDFPTALEVQEANERAVRKLVLPKCAGLSEKACFALQSKTSVVDYIINTDIKQICSLTMLSAIYAKNPLGDTEQTPQDVLDEIAKQISLDMRKNYLIPIFLQQDQSVQNPILEGTECSAGMIGKSIMSIVKDKILDLNIDMSVRSSFELPSIGIQF